MAIFNVTAANIQPGAERRGAAVDPPDTVTGASVQITDPDGVWDSTSGNILRWGVQASRADGTYANTEDDWGNQGCVFQDNLPFGSRAKDGSLPMLRMQGSDQNGDPLPIAPPGVKLRLAIKVDTAIVLGATVRTNADAA